MADVNFFRAADVFDNISVPSTQKKKEDEIQWAGIPEQQLLQQQADQQARQREVLWAGTPVKAVTGRRFEREAAKKLAMGSDLSVAPLTFNDDSSISVGRNIDRGGFVAGLGEVMGSLTEGTIDPERYAGYHITKNSDDNTFVGDDWLEKQAEVAEQNVRQRFPEQPFDRDLFKRQLKAFTLAKAVSKLGGMHDFKHESEETVYQMVNGMPDEEKYEFFEALLNVSTKEQIKHGAFAQGWNHFYEVGVVGTAESIGGALKQVGQGIGIVGEDTEQEKMDQAEKDFIHYLIERQRDNEAKGVVGQMFHSALEIAPGMIGGLGTGSLAKKGAEQLLKVGAKGATRAGVAGSTGFWWAQSKDAIHKQLVENGATEDSANAVSSLAAVPIAAIERFQVKSISSSWFKNLAPKTQQSLKQAFDVIKQKNVGMTQKFVQGGKALWSGTEKMTKNAAKETAQEVAQESLTMIAEDIGNQINDLDIPIDVRGRIMETWEKTGPAMLLLGGSGRGLRAMGDKIKSSKDIVETMQRMAVKRAIRETAGEDIANRMVDTIRESEPEQSDQIVEQLIGWVENPSRENSESLNNLKIDYEGETVGLGDYLNTLGTTGKRKAVDVIKQAVGQRIGDKVIAGELMTERMSALEADMAEADAQAQKVVEALVPHMEEDSSLKSAAVELARSAKTSRNSFRDFILSDESVFKEDGSIDSGKPRGRMILSLMEAMEETERSAQEDADILSEMQDGGKFIAPSLLMQMDQGNFDQWAVGQGASQQELSVLSREQMIDKYSQWANTRDRLRFLLPTNLEKAGLKTSSQREAFASKLFDAVVDTVESIDAERDQEVARGIEELLQAKRRDNLRNVIQRQADALELNQQLQYDENTDEAVLLEEMQQEIETQGELIGPESVQAVRDVALRELGTDVSQDVKDQITSDLEAIEAREPVKRRAAQQRVLGFLNNQSLGRQSAIAKDDFVQDQSQLKLATEMGGQFRELVDAGYLENMNEWTDFDIEAMWEGSNLNTDAVFATAVEVKLREANGEQLSDQQLNELIYEKHFGNKISYVDAKKKPKAGDKVKQLSLEEAQVASEPRIVSNVDDIIEIGKEIATLANDEDADITFEDLSDQIAEIALEKDLEPEQVSSALKSANVSPTEINKITRKVKKNTGVVTGFAKKQPVKAASTRYPDAEKIEVSNLDVPRQAANAKEINRLSNDAQRVQSIGFTDNSGAKLTADIYQDVDSEGNVVYLVYRQPKKDGDISKALVKGEKQARTLDEVYDLLDASDLVTKITGVSKVQKKAPTMFSYHDDNQRKEINDLADRSVKNLNGLLNRTIQFGDFDTMSVRHGNVYSTHEIKTRVREEVGDNPDYALILLDQIDRFASEKHEEFDMMHEIFGHVFGSNVSRASIPLYALKAMRDPGGGTVRLKGSEKRTNDPEVILEQYIGVPASDSAQISEWNTKKDAFDDVMERKEGLRLLINNLLDLEEVISGAKNIRGSFQFEKDEDDNVKLFFEGEPVLSEEEELDAANKEFQEVAEKIEIDPVFSWERAEVEAALQPAAAYGNVYLDMIDVDVQGKFESDKMDAVNAVNNDGDGNSYVLQQLNSTDGNSIVSLVWNSLYNRYSLETTDLTGEHRNNIIAVTMGREQWVELQQQENPDASRSDLLDQHRKHIEAARKVLPDEQFPSVVQDQYSDLFNVDFIKDEEVLEFWTDDELEAFEVGTGLVVGQFLDSLLSESGGNQQVLEELLTDSMTEHTDPIAILGQFGGSLDESTYNRIMTDNGVSWLLDNWHRILKTEIAERMSSVDTAKLPDEFTTDTDPDQMDLDFEASMTVPEGEAVQIMSEVANLTSADIEEAFPGSVVAETEYGYEIHLGENRVPVVLRTAITMSEERAREIWNNHYKNLTIWQGYSEQDFVDVLTTKGARGQMIVPGVGDKEVEPMERLGISGFMNLKAGLSSLESIQVIRHELVHLAFDTGMWTTAERNALIRKYSSPNVSRAQQSEDIAMALGYWQEPGTIQRFTDWINRMLHKLTGGLLQLSASNVERMMLNPEFWQRSPESRTRFGDTALDVEPEEGSPYIQKKRELNKVKRAIAREIKKDTDDDARLDELIAQRQQLLLDLEEIIRENARNIPGMREEEVNIDETVLQRLAREFDTEYDELAKGWMQRRVRKKFANVRKVSRDLFATTLKDIPDTLSAFIWEAWDIGERPGSEKSQMLRKIRDSKMGFMNYHDKLRALAMNKMDTARKKLTSKEFHPVLKEAFSKYLKGTKSFNGEDGVSNLIKKYIPDSAKQKYIVEALQEYEAALNEARGHIDRLSEEGIAIGLFQRPEGDLNLLEITVDENLGYYVNRSYALFESPVEYADFLHNTAEGDELVANFAATLHRETQAKERTKAEKAAIAEMFGKGGVFYQQGQKKRKDIRAEIQYVVKGLDKLPDGRKVSPQRVQELKELMESDAFKEDGPKYKSIVKAEMARYKSSMLLTKEGQDMVESQLDGMDTADMQQAIDKVYRIINAHAESAKVKTSGAEQDLGILQERKELSETYRRLLGEIPDAKANYAITVGKLAKMISTYTMQEQVISSGIFGDQIHTPEQGAGPNMKELVGVQWGPLEGHWVHVDAMKLIKDISGVGRGMSEIMNRDDIYGYLLTGMVAMSNAARMNKTVLSAKTVSRNMWEAMFQGFVNGAFSYGRLAEAYAVASDIAGKKHGALRWGLNPTVAMLDKVFQTSHNYDVDQELVEFLIKSGVVGNDDWRVIQDQIKMTVGEYSTAESLIPTKVKKEVSDKRLMNKIGDLFKRDPDARKIPKAVRRRRFRTKFNKLIGWVTDNKLVKDQGSMYRIPDDALKVNTFLTEVAALNRAYGTEWTKRQIWEEAAERTKRTTPTATRVPRIIKGLSAVPLVGNFPVWTTSFIQSVYGAYETALKDMNSGNRVMYYHGLRRLLRMMFMNAGLSTIASALMGMMYDDEEEEAIRSMLPEWSRNHTIIPTFRGGVLEVLDLSQTMPHVMFADWTRGLSEGWDKDGAPGAFWGLLEEATDPYFDDDIFWKSFRDVAVGTNEFGQEVYSPFDSWNEKIQKSLEYVTIGGRNKDGEFSLINRDWRGPLAPGTLTEMKRTYEAFKGGNPRSPIKRTPLGQLSRAAFGTEVIQINIENQLLIKYSTFKKKLDSATASLRKSGFSRSSEVFQAHLEDFRQEEALLHKELLNVIQGARIAGMSNGEIVRSLKEYGATNTDLRLWINGLNRLYVPGKDTLRGFLGTEGGKEKVKAILNRGERDE